MKIILSRIISILWIINLLILKVMASWPGVVCNWLPWCETQSAWSTKWFTKNKDFYVFIWNIISEMIKYVAVISLFSLVISWILYITSFWADDKATKAKKWITRSLVWVLISTSSWMLINLVNSFSIK